MKMYNVRFCGYCPKIHVEPIGQDCVAFKHQHSPFAEGLNLIIQGTDDVGICVQAGAAMPEQYKPSTVLHPVLMRVDQEQKVTKDARTDVEQDVEPQRYVTEVIREKHEVAAASLAEMENIAVTEETMLEATLQYRSGQTKAHLSPRFVPASLVLGHELDLQSVLVWILKGFINDGLQLQATTGECRTPMCQRRFHVCYQDNVECKSDEHRFTNASDGKKEECNAYKKPDIMQEVGSITFPEFHESIPDASSATNVPPN
ncbi:hypothetical protein Tco_1420291 [Tanacetum coccineum]